MNEAKQFDISKKTVIAAFRAVKENAGTYGVDDQTIEEFEKHLNNNLYKLWNRMASGSYFPKPVRAVAIPKKNGGTRILGIPTVEDRIAQMVAKMYFEPLVEPMFYHDSLWIPTWKICNTGSRTSKRKMLQKGLGIGIGYQRTF